jgi:pimeloyl-ACP methyl ester carboxylesterase
VIGPKYIQLNICVAHDHLFYFLTGSYLLKPRLYYRTEGCVFILTACQIHVLLYEYVCQDNVLKRKCPQPVANFVLLVVSIPARSRMLMSGTRPHILLRVVCSSTVTIISSSGERIDTEHNVTLCYDCWHHIENQFPVSQTVFTPGRSTGLPAPTTVTLMLLLSDPLATNPWEMTTKRALVSIGSYSLDLSTSGPPRKSNEPVVLFFTGSGVPIDSHIRLQALLSKFCRVYICDRAGYGNSEMLPSTDLPQTAERSAKDLDDVLGAVGVVPPYILVAHSYGAIVAREFFALRDSIDHLGASGRSQGRSIAGMVLAEGANELVYQVFHDGFPHRSLAKIFGDLDFDEITHLKEESGMTDDEWDKSMKMTERTLERGANPHNEDYLGSGIAIAKKRQLDLPMGRDKPIMGDIPLSVLRCHFARDLQIMYDSGVAKGNGTEKEREEAREFIQRWEFFDDQVRGLHLRLSANTDYRVMKDYGHDVVIRRPEIVVDQVQWVLQEHKRRQE